MRRRIGLAALLSAALCAAVIFASSAFGAAPAVTIGPAGPIGYLTAGVSGTVDPGGEPTTYRFQYITEEAFQANLTNSLPGFEGATTGIQVEGFEGSGPQPVSGELIGLAANTTYHLRLVAENGSGPAEAVAATFTTKEVAKPVVTAPTASAVSATTASLAGTVEVANSDPAFNAECHFEYATAADFSNAAATSCAPATVLGSESQPVPVTASLTNLFPGATYHLRLRATNAGGTTATEAAATFATSSAAPTITSTTASEVGSTSAVLKGAFNPGGAEAAYHFEYLTEAQFEAAGESFAGATSTPTSAPITTELNSVHEAGATISGLVEGTPYRYRLVVTNSQSPAGGTGGPVRTLATQAQGAAETQVCGNASSRTGASAGLPDCRVFELVTPQDNANNDAYTPDLAIQRVGIDSVGADLPFQASLDGETFTYAAEPAAGGNGAAVGGTLANQYLATHTSNRWTQENISAPATHFKAHYDIFSADLSVGVLQDGNHFGETSPLLPTAPPGNYKVLYARNSANRAERPLYTETPAEVGRFEFESEVTGGSEDFSTIVFDASGEPAEPGLTPGSNVYETTGGAPQLINRLPVTGALEPEAVTGAPDLTGSEGLPDLSDAVSTNGSRIYWTGLFSHGLYLHEDGAPTIQVDASEAGGSGGGGQFWTATPDGSQVFFTDDAEAGLTADTVPNSGVNLYRYDVDADRGGHHLTDLTPGADPEVRGVIGVSGNGSYVYYVAKGVLTSAANSENDHATLGASNVYVMTDEGGTEVTDFVASLTERDGVSVRPVAGAGGSGEFGDWVQGLPHRTAGVSREGGLAFTSLQTLTDYENDGLSEVYAYDPVAKTLFCASCDPSGAAPRPSSSVNLAETAAILPPSTSLVEPANHVNPTRATRWMSADGDRVFFDSAVPLVPQDTNGQVDVYEWERGGTGSCREAAGCVSLLSGGKSEASSFLMDADLTGKNVFFASREPLTSQGQVTMNVYDAREKGFHLPAPEGPCEGEACRTQGPARSSDRTPATSTVSASGNPKPSTRCKKGFLKKHGRCVKQKAKKGTHNKHKGSNKNHGKNQKRAGHQQGGGK
jgi:hypothetical protein